MHPAPVRTARSLVVVAAAVAAVVGGAALGGCSGPGLDVSTWQPAAVAAPARVLRITDGNGSNEAVGAAVDAALALAGDDGWFAPVDDTRDLLLVDGLSAHLDDGNLSGDSLYLRMDVVDWYTEDKSTVTWGTDENGNAVAVDAPAFTSHAHLRAVVADAAGRVLLQDDVEGLHDEQGLGDEEAGLRAATDDAVGEILAQITPQQTTDFVPFDDRNESERPILDRARASLLGAIQGEDAFIRAHDALPAPRYNRAVMLDATGSFDDALDGYAAARAHAPDAHLAGLLDDAEAGCLARRENARALAR